MNRSMIYVDHGGEAVVGYRNCCFVHESNLIRFVATSAICYFRISSFLGHNILFCMERYKCSLHDIITGICNHVVKQNCDIR